MLATFMNDVRQGGFIAPRLLADRLHMPLTRLSKLAHVNRNALASRPESPAVQQKLGTIARIIARAAEMTEDEGAAIIWFKFQPLAGFGGKTAAELVEAERAEAVMWFLDALDDGAYA